GRGTSRIAASNGAGLVHPPGIEPGRLAARDFKSLASTNFAMGAGIRLAEAVGFGPTKGANPCRFSRPVPSTTRPRFRLVSAVWYRDRTFQPWPCSMASLELPYRAA